MAIAALDRLNAYRAHPDPYMAAANTLALVLASDGPIYPLYLYFLVGRAFWPSLLALWVVPVYALVPLIARRQAQAARVVLIGASIANTALYTLVFGPRSQLQLFLLPCIALGLFFRHHDRYLAWSLGAIALAVYVLLRHPLIAPILPFSDADYRAIAGLSEVTVGTLTWFLLVLFGSMTHAAQAGRTTIEEQVLAAIR